MAAISVSFLLKRCCSKSVISIVVRSHSSFSSPFLNDNRTRTCMYLSRLESMKWKWSFSSAGHHKSKSRKAAVLIPLCEMNGEPSILLTLRSFQVGSGKGDMRYTAALLSIKIPEQRNT